jgi:hypothetical protein
MIRKKGQSTAEYAILIGLIIAAIVAIQPYVKRTLQGKYKTEADNFTTTLGSQLNDSGLSLVVTEVVDPETQFEYDQTVGRSTQNILTGTGATTDMATGGGTTRISTSNTQQGNNDFRGYRYGTYTPEEPAS